MQKTTLIGIVAGLCILGSVGWADPADPLPSFSSSSLGLTGGVSIHSVDVLSPGTVRFGLSGLWSEGATGNSLDRLESGFDTETALLQTRGSITVGIPYGGELAVSMPYVHLEPDPAVPTGGRGDLSLSGKWRLWRGGRAFPGAAVSTTIFLPTAPSNRPVRTVAHRGYQATLIVQSDWIDEKGIDLSWTLEVGGILKDPGEVERDEILLYGLGLVFPVRLGGLFDPETGLFGGGAGARYAWIAEANGSLYRGDQAPRFDDAVVFLTGLRYRHPRWGLTAAGMYTAYRRTQKDPSMGGTLLGYWVY